MVPEAPGSGARERREDALTRISNSFFLPFHQMAFSPWVLIENVNKWGRRRECEKW